MTNEIKKTVLIGCAGVGVLAFALAASPARAADPSPSTTTTREMGGSTPSETQTTHATVKVTAMDKGARRLTVKLPDGEKMDVQVPADVKEFDKVKVGDKIDVDYTESIAIGMAPKGTKPSSIERVATIPGAAGREVTVTAEVVKVDQANNKVTLKTQNGKKTVSVTDPDLQTKLASLKPGQVLVFQYTEAVAAAIQTK